MTLRKKSLICFLILLSVCSFAAPKAKKIRDYLTTIQWYPRYPDDLNHMLEVFFKNAESKPIPGKIVALIGPHAGLAYSGQCAARAYKQLEKLPGLERVIMLGVSHRGGFYGAAVSDFDLNSTPLGNIPVDTEITGRLAKERLFSKNNRLLQEEHSLETHLPFLQYIQKKLKNDRFKVVPILFGYLEKKDFAKITAVIKKYLTPKTLVIASSDFTHYGANYGYVPFRDNIKENLTKLDMGMIEYIRKLDFEGYWNYKQKTGITMCGFIPVGILINLFKDDHCQAALMDYYKSGDRQGDYSFSVSYASFIFSQTPQKKQAPGQTSVNRGPGKAPLESGESRMMLNTKEKKTLILLARRTLEDHFQGKQAGQKELEEQFKITPLLKEKAGVFVTLRKHGALRGCIGSIIGVEPLWEGVCNNVLKSAFQDPRFPRLRNDELKEVDIEISVMTPLQPLEDYKKIKLGTDGVVIRKDYHQAVYLPQVATETGWDLDQFLGSLCQKAGLPARAYQEKGMEFHIFQAQVFEETEPGH
jgi:MEMO1 family protein